MRLPRVIGHRGAAAVAPENTLEGLRVAARLGLRWVEVDAKLSADGVVVLFHDETLERTTDGRGRVAATRFAALRRLDAGAWFGPAWRGARVPTLEQALDLLLELGLRANVEIKPCPGREAETARAAVAAIRRAWPARRRPLLLSSFRPDCLAAARAAAPEMPRGLLVWERPKEWATRAAELGCRTVHCADRYLTRAWAARIKRLGYGLAVYTVNDPARARRLLGWGVDTLITDRPDAILALLSAAPARAGESQFRPSGSI